MQKITREAIRQMASSETVFYRGMRYYAAHAVSDVTWNKSSGQYRSVVHGSNQYVVTIQPSTGDTGLHHFCNCPSHAKQKGACKHVVATLLFIADYQQREHMGEELDTNDKTAYQIVEYFQKREYQRLVPTYYHLAIHITVSSMMKKKESKACLSLYAGADKMYKITNTEKFIADYYQEKNIRLGKQFYFVAGECAFDEASGRVMSYLTEIYEIQETLGKSYYSNLFSHQEMVLSQNMFLKLLRLAQGVDCRLSLFGREFENVSVVEGGPELSLSVHLKKDALILAPQEQENIISLTEDGTILFYQDTLYLPDRDYISNLLPFYSCLFASGDRKVDFRGENKRQFVETVLPVIQKTMQLEIPDELRCSYVVEPLRPALYLDLRQITKHIWVSARLEFGYGDYRVNPLREDSIPEDVILVRDREEERRLTNVLYDVRFEVLGDCFVLKNEKDIFRLMTNGFEELTDNFEVFYSSEYKKQATRRPGTLSAGIRLNTDINLLEVELGYDHVPKEELEDFFRSVQLKRKYYRLRSGAFIDLTVQDPQLRSLRWILDNGKIASENVITFHKSAALYLEEFFPEGSRLNRQEAYCKLTDDLKHPGSLNWEVPDTVTAVMRPYQTVGFQWLKTLARYGMGGILADDMGMGKTLQAIAYICSHPGDKTLVVCPTSLAYNWQEEFEKFAPSVRTCIVQGLPAEREAFITSEGEYDVWITTYPLIRRDTAIYRRQQYDHMFLDEAQFIKNPSSLGARAVKSVPAEHRFALTGTPIENALSELWSIFDFVMPGFFMKYAQFSKRYEKPIMREHDEEMIKELRTHLQPFILRRMKKDVLRDLPDKIETKWMVDMVPRQRKIYNYYLFEAQSELAGEQEDILPRGRIQVLAALTRLRQVCCHPGTFMEDYSGESGKLNLLMEQLPGILSGGHSVIIFSQFTAMLDIIAEELKKGKTDFRYLSGATKKEERREYVKSFNQGEVNVFLISLKAGGTGLNLTGADTVIHFDPWWNPAVEEQATDRAYRIGQNKKVQVIKMITRNSVEEKIAALQARKRMLSEQVVEAGEMFVNQLTAEELMELFQAG